MGAGGGDCTGRGDLDAACGTGAYWWLLRGEGGDPRERAGEERQKLRGEQGKMTMIVLC